MFSLTAIVLSLSLLASETLGAPNSSGPSRHARWLQTPHTDSEFLKRDNLEARGPADVGFSPLEKKDIFKRACDPDEVTCQGNKCCPSGYYCYYPTAVAACCVVGQTCTGVPVGCADPNDYECPASIGGCCPNGVACYIDSVGVARCDTAGLFSNSVSAPPITPTIVTPTTPVTPTSTPTPTSPGPVTVTVPVHTNGAEKVAMKFGCHDGCFGCFDMRKENE